MKPKNLEKKRLTVVLPSLRLYKSLGRSKILNSLEIEYEVSVVVPEEISVVVSRLDSYTDISTYTESRFTRKLNKFVLDVESFHLSSQNVSFETRIRLLTKVPKAMKLNSRNFIYFRSKYGLLLSLANLFFVRAFTRKSLRLIGSIHPGLNLACKETDPDLILCFSGGMYSGVENSLCRYSRVTDVPIFLVIDNWDNLSSKSVLWEHPNLLGVWGPEMENDAIEIHGVSADRILQLGSSRVDMESTPSEPSRIKTLTPYVLFAGSGIQHIDEVDAVLRARASLNHLGFSDLKIIYRPHPWMLRGSVFQLDERLVGQSGIELDIDIAQKGESSFYNLDSLGHLADLVSGCNFLIAGHSTVIVEALYSGKKVLAFTGSTHDLFLGVDSWSLYRHMERLKENKSVIRCNDFAKLDASMAEVITATDRRRNLAPELIPQFDMDYEFRILHGLQKLQSTQSIKSPN